MRVIAMTGLKGGVGKTAAAVNVAALAARDGHRTLLWDLDAQAAATHCFALRPKLKGGVDRLFGGNRGLQTMVKGTDHERLDVVPAEMSLRRADLLVSGARKPRRLVKRLLTDAGRRYEVVVIDCAPGIGAVAETVASSSDLLLVPVIPSPLGMRAFDEYAAFLAREGGDTRLLAPFLSLVDRRKPMHRRLEVDAQHDPRFLRASVALSSAVERLGEEQVPTVDSAPHSLAAAGYRQLWAEVAERADIVSDHAPGDAELRPPGLRLGR